MRKLNVLVLLLFVGITNVFAKNIEVTSVAELQAAIINAVAGDIIIMADATYKDADIVIKVNGITVKAATDGGVIFNGATRFKILGSNNIIRGFQFKNIDIAQGEVCEIAGNFNLLTQCNFFNCTSKHYIHTDGGSHDNEISYCNIEAKPPKMNGNCAIQITTSPTVVNHTKIRYCTFLNFKGDGGDFGNEPIRIGLGVEQNNISGCIVEYCYFENVGLGDSESISLKSTFNVVRYNTCFNNPFAQFVFRTGNKNSAYGNFFINSGGIRIKEGHNHMVYNNYFEGAAKEASLQLMNFKLNPKTLVGASLDTIYVYHNTFYNPGLIDLGGVGANPPLHVNFANNIFYKESGTVLSYINSNNAYINNILYGGAALGTTYTKNEFKNINPLLAKNSIGYYALTEKSPAINAADKSYPSIQKNPVVDNDASLMLDIEGQARPADATKKDIGCDEFSTDKILNKPLTRLVTGPTYLANISTTSKDAAFAIEVSKINDKASLENAFFKVKQNVVEQSISETDTRVIVALSNVKLKSSKGNAKFSRGEIEVIKPTETIKISGGEYFIITVKKNHPALTAPEKWLEPTKNKILYEDEQFRVFQEDLAAGDTRDLHSHAQRITVRLNDVHLTDPRFPENKLPGAGIQEANTFKYAEPVVHVVKNLSNIPLFNIVIEFKTTH